jgi:type II secretory pathway pseudopilin PulG
MGEVFRARHLIFGTDFVIKVMKPALRESGELQKRFIREALFARKVRHANVASVVDAARLPDDSLFIVAEFIEGSNLASVVRAAGCLPLSRCLNISRQILSGFEAIHGAGLVHRDLSPDNVMISGHDHVTIIDFGIAKQMDSEVSLTNSHLFLGKMRYASPEQLRADPDASIDTRSDLYSFGILLYEMLTGKVPFNATSTGALMSLHLFAPPPPLPPALGRSALQDVVNRSLAKDRNDRFQSAAELRVALENAIEDVSSRPSPEIEPTVSVFRTDFAKALPPQTTEPRPARIGVMTAVAVVLGVVALLALLSMLLRFNTAEQAARVATGTEDAAQAARIKRSPNSPSPGSNVVPAIPTPTPSTTRAQPPSPVVSADSGPHRVSPTASSGVATGGVAYWVDPETQLMWTVKDNGPNINWNDADAYCTGMTLGGLTGWRLASMDELQRLYDPSVPGRPWIYDEKTYMLKIREPIQLSAPWVWSGTKNGSSEASYFSFYDGSRHSYHLRFDLFRRALCVRGSVADSSVTKRGYWVDPETRLMWTVKDNGHSVNWNDATEYCRALTLGGFTGWTLPSIDELGGLWDPASEQNIKIKRPLQLSGSSVWSSTMSRSSVAWYFGFGSGQRGSDHLDTSDYERALCARVSAVDSSVTKGTPVGSETRAPVVSTDAKEREYWVDPETHLMWTVKDNGRKTSTPGGGVNWNDATEYCRAMTLGGFTGWRLPSIDELKGMWDPSSEQRAKIKKPLELSGFSVWSGTISGSSEAWDFYFVDGSRNSIHLATSGTLRALCVRGSAVDSSVTKGVTVGSGTRAPVVSTDTKEKGYWVDPETRLMWTVKDNGSNINWNHADAYCRGMTLGGLTGWRLASIDELQRLYDPSVSGRPWHGNPKYAIKIKEPIQLSGPWVWSGTKNGSSAAWDQGFYDGRRLSVPLVNSIPDRALCVRVSER